MPQPNPTKIPLDTISSTRNLIESALMDHQIESDSGIRDTIDHVVYDVPGLTDQQRIEMASTFQAVFGVTR